MADHEEGPMFVDVRYVVIVGDSLELDLRSGAKVRIRLVCESCVSADHLALHIT